MNGRITILLGAGASIPFIGTCDEEGRKTTLTTRFLTDVLSNETRWNAVLGAYRAAHPGTLPEDIVRAAEIVQKIAWIRAMLCEGKKTWDLNFENILHILDRLGGYLGSDETMKNRHIDEILIDLGRCRWIPRQPKEEWDRVPALAREVLATAIRELWEKCDREDAILAYQHFFCGLSDSANISIYSLNYDPLLLESIGDLPHFSTGFTQEGEFDPERMGFFGAANVLGFLHGHIGLVKDCGRTCLSTDYAQAQSDRLRSNSLNELGQKGRHYNTFLITGLDKIEGFNHDPFGVCLHRLALDLRESKEVIMVGYSFADYHLNAFVANAVRLGVERVIYVTLMKPCELCDVYVPLLGNKLLELASSFGDSSLDIREEDHVERLGASCRDSGYGHLTKHLWLYIKGTEEFLKQEYPFVLC